MSTEGIENAEGAQELGHNANNISCAMYEETGTILQHGTCWVYICERELPDEKEHVL